MDKNRETVRTLTKVKILVTLPNSGLAGWDATASLLRMSILWLRDAFVPLLRGAIDESLVRL